jgi:hypothetical protein
VKQREAATLLFASVTLRVKLNSPVSSGVPFKEPSELRFKPGGNLPSTRDHDNGGTPETACKFSEKNSPNFIVKKGGVIILSSDSLLTSKISTPPRCSNIVTPLNVALPCSSKINR